MKMMDKWRFLSVLMIINSWRMTVMWKHNRTTWILNMLMSLLKHEAPRYTISYNIS
jgi:hypothetical protein